MSSISSRSELHAWIVIVLAMAAMYVYGSLLSRAEARKPTACGP